MYGKLKNYLRKNKMGSYKLRWAKDGVYKTLFLSIFIITSTNLGLIFKKLEFFKKKKS